jgi:NAD(P)-dependent dehydrogenase (short-subunit alcohol dehydrogenase family)
MMMHQVALITGCSSGIGYETALMLARNGYHTFATMRNPKKSDSLLKTS